LDLIPRVADVRKAIKRKYNNKDFIIDKSGVKMIELLGTSFIADEDYIIREPNFDYTEREIRWYESKSLNVYDIPGKVPEIWKQVSDKDGNINSNYGYLVHSDENGNQFLNCIRELKKNPNSRRAIMIYNRPSMHVDYNKDGMSDFICTMFNSFYIRNNRLYSIYSMRSNDSVFGYCNDKIWASYIFEKVYRVLKETYRNLIQGDIIWQAASLHVYERHFKFIEKL